MTLPSNAPALAATAQALVAPGKGLLAADESQPSIAKRFDQIGLASSETSRRDYREMLLSTPGIAEFISGVILFDETLKQRSASGSLFVDSLHKAGIIPGIKVDTGAQNLPFCPGEKITEGLDGLRGRLAEYYRLGARFAKWRAVLNVTPVLPSLTCLTANAEALARYAALCQEQGLVPIVEPEVIMDGAHTIDRCEEVTEAALVLVFHKLREARVYLPGVLLKPNMVISATDCAEQADVPTVAQRTISLFQRTVPAAVPGIVFLSGGQSEALATAHLNAMNQMFPVLPWQIGFSYGRALQAPALKAWGGKAAQVEAGRQAFAKRARLNSAARYGKYSAGMEAG